MSSLSGLTVAAAYARYLQTGGGTLSSGFLAELGDGSQTGLWLDSNGIGFKNNGFVSSFRCAATANQTITINYTASAGMLYPEQVAVLAADTANSTVTAATVSGFSITLAPSALYEFDLILVFKSAATTTSPRFTLNGPTAQMDFVSYEITDNGSTNAQYQAFAQVVNNAANAPAANTPYAIRVQGICRTTGTTPAVPVTLDILSEVATSAITLCAGSIMRFKKLN